MGISLKSVARAKAWLLLSFIVVGPVMSSKEKIYTHFTLLTAEAEVILSSVTCLG
jgi:hypothetical protein